MNGSRRLPYAGTDVGTGAFMKGAFQRLITERFGYRADIHTYIVDGDRVAALGIYSGTYKATGKAMTALPASLRAQEWKDRATQYVYRVLVAKALS